MPACSGDEANYAKMFADFVADDAQNLIASYGVDVYGQPLFYPAKDKLDWLSEKWRELSGG